MFLIGCSEVDELHVQNCSGQSEDEHIQHKALESARARALEQVIFRSTHRSAIHSVLDLDDLTSLVLQYCEPADWVLDRILPMLRLQHEVPMYILCENMRRLLEREGAAVPAVASHS